MAFPNSGLFVPTFRDALNGTIALDLDLVTHKVALFTNTITADLTTNTAYGVSPWLADAGTTEVAGLGYTAGGYTLANTTWAHSSLGIVQWKNTVDPNWTTATITAYGALYYADGLTGNNAICAQTFGGTAVTSTAGTFTIVLSANASVIFSIDFVP